MEGFCTWKTSTGLHFTFTPGKRPFVAVMIDVCVKCPVITVYTRFQGNALSLIVNLYKVSDLHIHGGQETSASGKGFVRNCAKNFYEI